MIDRFVMMEYLGEGWKEFRNGTMWSDLGLLKEKLDSDNKWMEFEIFCNITHWNSEESILYRRGKVEGKEITFSDWLFTPERFCKLVLEFWEKEKDSGQNKIT